MPRSVLLFVALLMLYPAASPAQSTPAPAHANNPTRVDSVRVVDTVRMDVARPDPGASLLDAPISRTEYILGPGDVVDVSIFGALNRLHSISVTPEGTLVIPGIGVARVLGLNLDQAQVRVRDLVFREYRNVEVNLTLAQVRTFKVFVLGDVPAPGVRAASSATRVSEVVPGVGGNGVVRRNVLLRRASNDTVKVDLVRFLQTGDLSANPTLREGDALVVPTVDETVQVFGRVAFPGTYEYRQGESLAQLLSITNGGRDFPSDAADSVRLTRFVNREQREFHVFSRAEALGAAGRGFLLQPFDAVYIAALANFKQQRTATIQGQVVRPGTYPIRPDTTTVRDLVMMAGGFTPEASLVDATLRRQPQAGGAAGLRQLQNTPTEALSRTEQQILQIRSQGDQTNVVIDFPTLFAGGRDAYNQTLESGDLLTVPRRRNEVIVLGAVPQPGMVRHAPGRDVNDYIALAGGYSRQANRGDVVILKAKLGTRIDAREARSVDPGDQIIVPFRDRRQLAQTLQTVGTVVTTVTSIILAVIAIGR